MVAANDNLWDIIYNCEVLTESPVFPDCPGGPCAPTAPYKKQQYNIQIIF